MEWIILLFVATLFGGFIKGFAGFGSSLFIGGMLLLTYDPIFVIPLMVVISITLNVLLFIEHVHHLNDFKANFAFRKETLFFLIVGIIIGAYLLKFLDPGIVKIIFGVLMLIALFFVRKHLHIHKHTHPTTIKNSMFGLISGVFSGLININGPFASLYGLFSRYNKIKLMKATVMFSFVADLITLIVFYLNDYFSFSYMYVVAILVALLGFIIGKELRVGTDHTNYKKWIYFLLLILSIKIIFDGIYVLII